MSYKQLVEYFSQQKILFQTVKRIKIREFEKDCNIGFNIFRSNLKVEILTYFIGF